MKTGYNIYYKGNLVNNAPIDKETLEAIKKRNTLSKVNPVTKKIETIDFKSCRVVTCVTV